MATRTYYDPLHKGIKLDSKYPEEKMIMELIDSAPFQRLRRIKQLGPASLTFHGAESSRFTHSIGVFHIARRAFNQLIEFNKDIEANKGILFAAALLHDIGHGPLSHTSEAMFGLNHEEWSSKLITEHPEIRKVLDGFDRDLAENISSLLQGKNINLPLVKSLVSSQVDCDRIDYLMRDSYSTGAKYGQLDLDRILSAFTLAPDGDLAIHPKGLLAVEHYLIVRKLMYRSVYNHRLNEICNWMLEQIIKVARKLGPSKVWADVVMGKWLWNPDELDISIFLSNDDIRTGYHLAKWQEESPKSLQTLCKNFLGRKLPKAIDVEALSIESQLEALALARKLSELNGHDPDLCCGLRCNKIHGYHPYKSGLRLWDGKNLKAIEQESLLIKQLISPSKTTWLIHPKEINIELEERITKIKLSS